MPQDSFTLPPSPPESLMGGEPPQEAPKAKGAVTLPPKPPQDLGAGGWDTPAAPEVETRTGDAANPIEDVWNLTNDMVTGVGHVFKGYYDLINDPKARDEWYRGASDLFSGKYHKDVGNYLWKGIKEDTASHWTDTEGNFDLGYTLWHHPASALMDLAVVKDLAGGGVKMAGKVAGGTSRAALTAEEAAKLGQMSKADRIVQMGEKLHNMPIDPYQLMGKAAGKLPGVKSLKEELGFGPRTKEYDAIAAGNEAEVNAETSMKAKLILDSKLGPGAGDRVFNAMDRGSEKDFLVLQPEERDFINRYKATQGQWTPSYQEQANKLPNREQMLKERDLIPQDTKRVMGIQAALREWGEGGVTDERIAEAMDKIASGEWSPTYRFLAHEKSHEFSMLENFMKDARGESRSTGGQGIAAQLEGRTGKGVYEKDPLAATYKQIQMEGQFDKRVRLMDKVLDHALQSGEVRILKGEREIPTGWKVVPDEIWKKYLLSEKRAAGLAWAEAANGADVTTAAREAFTKFAAEPGFMEAVKHNRTIAVPNYLANWLRFRLSIPSPLARTYDKLARYWKSAATLLRPNYWMNVVAGNGFLSALHGVSPMDAIRYWKNRHVLPPELRAIMQTAHAPGGASTWQKSTTNLRNFDSMVHVHLTKGPGFAHEVEGIRREVQGTAKALEDAGHKFFVAADTIADPNKFFQLTAAAPEKLSAAIGERVMLREQLASHSREIFQKEREWDAVNKELEGIKGELAATKPKNGRKGPAFNPDDLEPGQMTQFNDLSNKKIALRDEIDGLKEQFLKRGEREGVIGQQLPELKRVADWAEKAIEPINDLEGAYLRLHPLERQWISRAIPFYPWTKAMSKLVFMLPFAYPKSTFMWNRYGAMMSDLSSHEEHMPEWLQGAVPVGHTADGSTIYIRPIWNPFKGEKPTTLGGVTLPGIVGDLPQRHPIFKVAHDLIGGVDSFTMKPWSTNEYMTRMDTGEVFKMDAKTGEWVRTVAQPSLRRRLWGLFPQSQMIDQLFLPHVQSDKGWIGHPDPVRVGGEPIAVPFMQRLTKTLLPVSFQSEDQKNMAEAKQGKIYKQYVSEIRKMQPDEQATALKVLNDALRVRK